MNKRVLFVSLLLSFIPLLSGCGPNEHNYEVSHFNQKGEVVRKYRATLINSHQGCFYFRYENQENGEEDPTICGNVLAVPVERVDPKDYDKSVDPIYEIRQFRADGTVFKTHNATWFRAVRGCIHFRAPQYPIALNDPVICGNVIAQKKPQ